MGKTIVEATSELSVGKGLGQVFFGQKAGADGSAYGSGESGLVLGDGPLEKLEGPAEEAGRLIGMKEHPDGHSIRETPCQGPENDSENRLKSLFGHGQRCM
jgi:hypothetical protein